jgi:3-deoxy-D-manno-octulosonate 8-phosphate phosphatase KdsC-like HAD superfamily phosphatase
MHTTSSAGGNGAVREAIELILQAQGHWDDLLRKYEVEN